MRILDNEPEDEFEINILPMIDVIFAILAFFIVLTLFLTRRGTCGHSILWRGCL